MAIATGLVVLLVLGTNGWVETPDGWVSGGWNWSDFLVHVSIGSSIAAGNFPPEVPYFAGEPLTYHWFADFHGAITSTVAGVDIIGVYFLTSALFAGVLALVVWALAMQLTARRSVATIAAIIACATGGLGWIRLVGDVIAGKGDVLDLVAHWSYDNTWADGWPFFKIASIFSTGFLPHRATTLGLPGLVVVVLLIVACIGRRPAGVLLAGILAALLAPFQFFAFPATYLIVGLYVVTTGAWRQRTVLRDAVLFLAPVILATPFIVGAIVQQSDIGSFKFVLGWATAPLDDGPAAVAFFYLTNLGIPFVLAVIAAFTARGMPYRWFLAAWVLALFIVPNVVEVSAVVIRHEQVLPDHVDRGRDPGRLAAPSLAAAGGRAPRVHLDVLDRAHRRLAHALARRGAQPAPGSGRPLDRDQHAGAIGVHHRRLHQQPGRPGRAAADHDLQHRTCRTSATTRRRARSTPRPSTATGPTSRPSAWRSTARRTCSRAAGSRATTPPPPTSPRATGSRRSTTRTGSRSGGWPGRSAAAGVQPLGSTTIVTSGVMPVKTLIATLYVPSVLSGSSRSILWRSTSMPRRASASAMSLDVIEP